MNRAAAMAPMDAAAGEGRLAVQRCHGCGAMQYPPREFCSLCLDVDFVWVVSDDTGGEVLSVTTVLHSHDEATRAVLPLRIGLVSFDEGPVAVCFLPEAMPGRAVRIRASLDALGRAVLTAR